MKKILLLVSVLALAFTLSACKPEEEVDSCDPTEYVDGVWSNLNLRKALSYAIDREAITATLGAGQVPAGGIVPPGFIDDDGLDFFAVAGNYGLETDDTNYAEAVTLFALAATEMGMTVAELQDALEQEELLYNTSEAHATVAQLVQQNWASTLGFTIPLANEEWAVFQDTRSAGNFSVARGGWLTDFMDPSGMLTIFGSTNAYNDPNYYNSAFDTLLNEAQSTTDMAVHFDKLYAAQEMFMLDMPIVPVYHSSDTMLVSDNLQNWGRSVLGTVDFSAANMAGVDQTFNWNIGADPATLDPALNGASDGGNVINNTFEGLVREINGEVLPGVAESWVTSADGLTVTFTLRDSKWSNGDDLVAGDFVYAWLRGMDPASASEYSWIWEYTNVVGSQAYAECSETDCSSLRDAVGISAPDDNTLVVELVNPTSYFVSLMAFFHFMPVNQTAVETGADGTWAKDPANAVSNGPYVLTSYTTQAGLTLEKNDNYWNAANVDIETIDAKFNDDANSAYAAYQNDQFDFIPSVPTSEVATLIAESDEFYVFAQLGTYYYSFNMDGNKDGVNQTNTVCPE